MNNDSRQNPCHNVDLVRHKENVSPRRGGAMRRSTLTLSFAIVTALAGGAALARGDGKEAKKAQPPLTDPAAIVKALASDDDDTVEAGYAAVEELGAAGVSRILAACDKQPDDVLGEVADAIAEIGEAAAKPLVLALTAQSEDVRTVAISALLTLDDDAVPALLLAVKNGSEDLRNHAALVLIKMDNLDVDLVAELVKTGHEDARATAAAILMQFGETGAEALVPLMEKEGEPRNVAIRSLVEIGAAAVAPLIELGLRSTNQKIQDGAVDALVEIGDPSVGALLRITKDPRPDVRGSAICALGDLGDEKAVPVAIAMLDDKDESVRDDAMGALESLSGEKHATREEWETWWRAQASAAPGGKN